MQLSHKKVSIPLMMRQACMKQESMLKKGLMRGVYTKTVQRAASRMMLVGIQAQVQPQLPMRLTCIDNLT